MSFGLKICCAVLALSVVRNYVATATATVSRDTLGLTAASLSSARIMVAAQNALSKLGA